MPDACGRGSSAAQVVRDTLNFDIAERAGAEDLVVVVVDTRERPAGLRAENPGDGVRGLVAPAIAAQTRRIANQTALEPVAFAEAVDGRHCRMRVARKGNQQEQRSCERGERSAMRHVDLRSAPIGEGLVLEI